VALNTITEKLGNKIAADNTESRRPKTFVLSKRSLEAIEKLSRKKKIPRDAVVELSVRRLLPVLSSEREKHKTRSLIYRDIKRHYEEGIELLEKAERLLGRDDVICEMVEKSNKAMEKAVSELETLISRGKVIAEYKEPGSLENKISRE